jgi:dolichyl-phosphate beta-glucosyltransferase
MISIIIPCLNETQRLPGCIEQIKRFKLRYPEPIELIIADNGSTDGTSALARWYHLNNPWIHPIRTEQRGKGLAVKMGMDKAMGNYLYMADVDLSTPITELPKFMDAIRDADIVIGSRAGDKVITSVKRWVIGRAFHLVTSSIVPGIYDTQCGFKLFRRDAGIKLASQMKLTGLAFDVELLYLARRANFRVSELPVEWRRNSDSRVRLGVDSLAMLRDVLKIPYLHRV